MVFRSIARSLAAAGLLSMAWGCTPQQDLDPEARAAVVNPADRKIVKTKHLEVVDAMVERDYDRALTLIRQAEPHATHPDDARTLRELRKVVESAAVNREQDALTAAD